MLRHELYGMVQIASLKDENAPELLLRFRIGAVGRSDFAVLPIKGECGLGRLKRFSTRPVTAGTKMVVVFKARVEHRVSLALAHAIEFAFVVVTETEVFHVLFLLMSIFARWDRSCCYQPSLKAPLCWGAQCFSGAGM